MNRTSRVSDMDLNELQHQHRELSDQLEVLARRAHLTPSEQIREKQLKKLKLRAKDRIARLSEPPPRASVTS